MKQNNTLSTRIFSFVLFILSCIGLYLTKDLNPPFSYEPLGPKAFPLAALVLIALCCILLFFFGDKTEVYWGDLGLWKKNISLALAFVIFILMFENLGFIIATSVFSFLSALIFKAKIKYALCFALILALFLYYGFDKYLEVTLPLGFIFTQD